MSPVLVYPCFKYILYTVRKIFTIICNFYSIMAALILPDKFDFASPALRGAFFGVWNLVNIFNRISPHEIIDLRG